MPKANLPLGNICFFEPLSSMNYIDRFAYFWLTIKGPPSNRMGKSPDEVFSQNLPLTVK